MKTLLKTNRHKRSDQSEFQLVSEHSSPTSVLDVIFLHGLDGEARKTWSSHLHDSFWPAWIAEDPRVAVWTVGYPAGSTKITGHSMHLYDRATNILARMQDYETPGYGQHILGTRPFCLVGHSLGGLVAKQMIYSSINAPKWQHITQNVCAVAFLATPHSGASVARIARRLRLLFRPTIAISNLQPDDGFLRQLNDFYPSWAAKRTDVAHVALYETQNYRGIRVVGEESANPGIPNIVPIAVDANHVTICKPSDREQIVYKSVSRMIDEAVMRLTHSDRPHVSKLAGERTSDPQFELDPIVRGMVMSGDGWVASLSSIYPNYPLLDFAGSKFPIWVAPATASDQLELDAPRGRLATNSPSFEEYPREFDPAGADEHAYLLATADGTTRFNGPAYAFERLDGFPSNRLRIDARPGTYFHSLVTSEALEREFIRAQYRYGENPLGLCDLPNRKEVHARAGGNPVVDGSGRAAALSVAATIIISEADGTYYAILSRRSEAVETHTALAHVAPSGIAAPLSPNFMGWKKEFSFRQSILREYAEELFDYKELATGESAAAWSVEHVPPVRELLRASETGEVVLRYCGISVPLLTLRPEVCYLIWIRDPKWLQSEVGRAQNTANRFGLNWEYEAIGNRNAIRLELDEELRPVGPNRFLTAADCIPNAAACLHLATTVARVVLKSDG